MNSTRTSFVIAAVLFLIGIGVFVSSGIIPGALSPLLIVLSFFTIGLGLFLILDKRMRKLMSYAVQNFMKWIRSIFGDNDPIKKLKKYQDDMDSTLKKMRQQMNKLRAQLHKLKELITNNDKGVEENLVLAHKYRDVGEKALMVIHSRKASRLKESNKKLNKLYDKITSLLNIINKMYDNSLIFTEDIKDQIELKQREHSAILSGHSAMKSASDILQGKGDKVEEFENAISALSDDISYKVGEMERFMSLSENFMNSMDLQKGINEEKGLELLDEWEQKTSELLNKGEKELNLLEESIDSPALDLDDLQKVQAKEKEVLKNDNENRYDNFFDF